MTRSTADLPSALDQPLLRGALGRRRPAVFCDYDGTLTPIVARPELATIPAGVRRALARLAAHTVVAIVSGRDLIDVRRAVDLDGLWYAGSHGFDVLAPDGSRFEAPEAVAALPALDAAAADLAARLAGIPGAWVERKRFAVAVHFRQVDEARVPDVEQVVDAVHAGCGGLRKTGGKRIWELRPDIGWDKGRAVWWLFGRAGLREPDAVPVYLGDDVTDEDAFAALEGRGLGIVVTDEDRPTRASFALRDPDEVRSFLEGLAGVLEDPGA